MINRLRALFVVVEEGSVNRAAVRLRIGQPALSRQMQQLEEEVGGRLLEREARGVTPTGLGHALIKTMRPILDRYEAAWAQLRRQARGEKEELRVGYLVSAAQAVLTPALARLRRAYPALKLRLHDMSPKEQIDALRGGSLDVALIGQEGAIGIRDFHSRKLGSLGVCAALAASDPLATRRCIAVRELRGRDFIGVDDEQAPGRNRWISTVCRTAGFRPRFTAITDGITHVLSQVVAESAVTLLPDYFRAFAHPGVVFIPVSDATAQWDFFVLWQRGSVPPTTHAFVTALQEAMGSRQRGSTRPSSRTTKTKGAKVPR